LKFAVLQGCYKAKSLKNCKSLQAQACPKTVRVSAQSISFGTGSRYSDFFVRIQPESGFAAALSAKTR
jgi:hypothetical protein